MTSDTVADGASINRYTWVNANFDGNVQTGALEVSTEGKVYLITTNDNRRILHIVNFDASGLIIDPSHSIISATIYTGTTGSYGWYARLKLSESPEDPFAMIYSLNTMRYQHKHGGENGVEVFTHRRGVFMIDDYKSGTD